MSYSLASEFAVLKDRAQQLFDGLRDLPPYGQKLWEPYFHRTFDVYNKLWSELAVASHFASPIVACCRLSHPRPSRSRAAEFQQERRAELEAQCGLRRHQIGETASRIGQLYYQFYLRKGDNCYLDEAYVFYSAIRSRQYFALGDAYGLSEHESHQLELRQARLLQRRPNRTCTLLDAAR